MPVVTKFKYYVVAILLANFIDCFKVAVERFVQSGQMDMRNSVENSAADQSAATH